MASNNETLCALENLLSEFFSAETSNERKRQIESILGSFAQTSDAWRHCQFFLTHTQNEFVMMFSLNVLENLINKQWLGVDSQDKMEIRAMLNQFLLGHHRQVMPYVRNKLVKLVVDIGRTDWPHFYPDFFPSILQLLQQQDTVALGVNLLQTASEELASPREDLSMARKEELHRLLLIQVPTILSLLNNVLESVLEKHRHLVAATPPPSPTQSDTGSTRRSSLMLFSSSPIRSDETSSHDADLVLDTLISNMFKSPGRGVQVEALPPLDLESLHLCSSVLTCLAHYFSWVPLSSFITPQLLSTIFHFAGFGCEVRSSRCPNTSFTYDTQNLGMLAMTCINELLSKNCVPQEFEDFLLQMFQQTFYLLQKLTKESNTNSRGNRLEELQEGYVDKFTDFLRLFVSVHLRRFESNPKFPVLEFLALFFKYTFRQPTHDGFFHCLDIWNTFLDYLQTSAQNRQADREALLARYKEALMSLVSHILQKLQFRHNQSQLDGLDDETLDDDSETEWQHFLRECLEVIAKVAELLTAETFQILWEPFKELMEAYLGLNGCVSNGVQGRQLAITAENECRRLHCTLRDLSSLLQAMGRLAEHFTGEHFASRYADASILIERLVFMVDYGTKSRLFEVSSAAQSVLHPDFIEVQAQSLASIKAYAHWLAQFGSESQRTNTEQEKYSEMILALLNAITPLFNKQVPEKIVHSAAHLLMSLTTTVRPSFLLRVTAFQDLYSVAGNGGCDALSQDVQLLLFRSLSHYLLLAWPNVGEADQLWETRASHHQCFARQLDVTFLQLGRSPDLATNKALQVQAKPVIKRTLKIFQDWIESIAGEVVKSKQICYQSLQEPIQVTLAIFPIYIHHTDVVEDVMSFFLALFQGLRVQMGVPFTEQTIQTFLNLFTREQLADTICQESVTAFKVVEKFLKILQLIVQEPGSAFRALLPRIITICMEHVYPIIAQRQAPDMKSVLYELLHELLMNNWRYFFKGSVMAVFSSNGDEMENSQQFQAIMQAYGESFCQQDISSFRQNLESLEGLNAKWKLYDRTFFKEVLLFDFLLVLVKTLVQKSHNLLQEEIVISVYNMASVDFDKFYTSFLPNYLSTCEGLDDNQRNVLAGNFKQDKDLPSFTQNMHRMVNDIRYYRLINSSLPSGSFKF